MNNNDKVIEALEEMSHRKLGEVKVLMVEDDMMIRDMVNSKLIACGCIPYSADDGEQVIALASQFQPDVIILDLMLPGRSGEEILNDLKNNPELKHIPVIIFTNKSADENESALKEAGAVRYFVKASTELDELVTTIKELSIR